MIQVHALFDAPTSTLTYLVWDETLDAVIIDPVMDYDQASSTLSAHNLKSLTDFVDKQKLKIMGILETHAHADHVTGSRFLKSIYPNAKTAIGAGITQVQSLFKDYFQLEHLHTDGRQFDLLLNGGKTYAFGSLKIEVFATPGHTPACSSYKIGEHLFTGDALFMPDSGTGRCDFPGGSAAQLYDSISQIIYHFQDSLKIYTGHDYQPNQRPLLYCSTVGEQKRANIHLKADTSKDAYLEFRSNRDKTLAAPKLLLPSVQINIDAGNLPPKTKGKRYLKLPLFTDGKGFIV